MTSLIRTDGQLDYLAGFFDAEGCVYFSSNGKQEQVMYSVGQSDPTVLYLFQKTFGGSVRKRKEATDRHREQWLWQKTCVRSDEFCPLMIGRTVIKRHQIGLAMEFSKTIKPRGMTATEPIVIKREVIRKQLSAAKGTERDREDVVVPSMPIAYWAGLFDGDGSAGIRKCNRCFYPKASIFSCYVPVLESAKRQFSGNVLVHKSKRAREWRTLHQNVEAFLRSLEPHLIVKAAVVRSVLALKELAVNGRLSMVCDSRGWNRKFADSVIQEMESLARRIRELNRQGPDRRVA